MVHTIDIRDTGCVCLILCVQDVYSLNLPHPSNSAGPPHMAEQLYYVAYISNHVLVLFLRLRRWYLSLTYIGALTTCSLPFIPPASLVNPLRTLKRDNSNPCNILLHLSPMLYLSSSTSRRSSSILTRVSFHSFLLSWLDWRHLNYTTEFIGLLSNLKGFPRHSNNYSMPNKFTSDCRCHAKLIWHALILFKINIYTY